MMWAVHQTISCKRNIWIPRLVANLLLFQFSVRHSLTAKALEELLMLLSAMLPADAKLPKTACPPAKEDIPG